MSSRKKSKGTKGNKNTRKNKPISNTKNIDDYLHDSLFPISPNEYITITLETCSELKENPKYNYKVSSIKKHTFTQDIPDYNEYSSLTMEALQEGIKKLNLKDPNSFIRLMLISGNKGLKIWKLDNQKYETNTNNKEKCGYGTPIYEELIPIAFADSSIEPVVLQPIQNEGFVEEQQEQIDLPDILEPDFESEPVVDYIPAPVVADEVADEARIAAEAKAEEARDAAEANDEETIVDEMLLKSLSNKDFFDYEDDADNGPWHNTKQGLLKRIDEITDQVKQTKYEDDKTEISDNMDLLKVLVDELGKSYKLLTPIIGIEQEPGKNECDTALNYIQDNRVKNSTKPNLYDDYEKVNDKYITYITYKTGWLSINDFEEHKQNFINELDNFKKNLVKKIFSTFEYGDREYCKDISPNNNDDLIKSVEDANKRAETVLSQDDSVINRVNPYKTLLRSNSAHSGLREPLFPQPTRNEIKQNTSLPGFITKAKPYMSRDDAFNLWNEGKNHYEYILKDKFNDKWENQNGKGKKTKKKRTTRSTKQKSNTKTVKNMERKRKTRKITK